MERFRRILKWLLLGLGLLLLLVVTGVVVYTRTENFTRWVRQEAVSAANNFIRGTVSVERLQGSVWSHLTLHNVVLRYEEIDVVQIPRLEVSFSLLELIWGRLKISQIDALNPRAILHQDSEGRWNIAEALAPREPKPEQSSDFTTLVRSLRLRDAGIDLQMASADGKIYRLQNLDLEGSLGILPDGVSLDVRELASGLVSKGLPDLRVKGALAYQKVATAPATLKITDLWAVSQNSRVKLNGEVTQGDALKIKAQAALDKLSPSDIGYFVADWPLKRDLAGNVTIEGALDDLTGSLNLTGAGAKLAGKFRANAVQDPLQYTAALAVSGFDLRQWLGKNNLAGVVSGTVDARGNGFALQNTAGNTKFEIRSTEIQGWELGTVAMQAQLDNSIAVLDGQVDGTMGGAHWSGRVSLKDKRPTYELALSVKNFPIEKAVPNSHTIKGKLNLQGTVKGAGFNLADMNTRAEMRVLPSSVGPVNVKQGLFDVTVRDEKILISRATLNAAESVLTVNGEIGLNTKAAGKLDYRFRAADIGPWLSLLNQKGSGSVNLAGQAQGNLADIQTQGTARVSGVRLEGAAVRSGDVRYALRGSKDQVFPEGLVTFRLAGVDAGLALRRVDAKATLSRSPSRAIQLDVSAQDSADRNHALNGTMSFAPGVMAMRLNQISLAAPDGLWKLARPATLTKRDNLILIEQLSLRNGDREVSLDGSFGFTGQQDLRLNVDRLPLETLSAFMSKLPKMSGVIGGSAQISGTAAAPEITSILKLTDPTIAGQAYAGAVAEVRYKGRKAVLRLTIQQDTAHSLSANGTIPLLLSWNEKLRAEPADGMDVRVQSTGVSMGFLNAFSGKAVENIGGEMELDVVARGSIKQPDLRGTFRLRDGKLKVVPLNVDVHTLTINGGLDSRSLIIREISARAKDGEIRGSGSLALKQYELTGVKLALNAKRWPAIDTMRYQLRVAGNVDVQGTIAAPAVKGQINITEGSLRPDLALLEQSKAPLKRDETIVIINNKGENHQSQRLDAQSSGPGDSGFFKNVSLDIAMRAPGNVWVRHPDLVAELSGNVRMTKAKERDLDLTGRVDVVRGWFAFQGRRFQLARGTVQFTGGDKINPSLDIVAQYRLPEYQVEATISGTAEKPSLTLASQPPLEQADILALILFGRPLNTLDQNEQASLQQSAINLASGFVAGRIAKSVATALGLDSLGIDIREVDFSGGRVGFGRYVGRKTYVSASQQLSGEHGREISLEYEVAKDWKIGTSTNSTGSSGIDIIWHKRY